MAERTRVGILSAGAWSASVHLPTLAARDDVELVVLSRPDQQLATALANRFGVAHATADWCQALELGLDAVIVSSPPAAHEDQVMAALRSGADVLCEKPFATEAGAAARMLEVAESTGRALLVGFGWTIFPPMVQVRELIASGAIGTIEHLVLHLGVNTRDILLGGTDPGWLDASSSLPATYSDPAASGGGAAAVSLSHGLSVLLELAGGYPERVSATMYPATNPIDLHDAVILNFPGGVNAAVSCASSHRSRSQVDWWIGIYGDAGLIRVNSSDGLAALQRADEANETPFGFNTASYRPGAPTDLLVTVARGMAPIPDGCSALRALEVVSVTEALYRSAVAGAPAIPASHR